MCLGRANWVILEKLYFSGFYCFFRYPHLLAELLADPAWSEKDIALLAGLNVLRVFEKVEAVRDQWKLAAILPGEDTAPHVHSSCSSIYS